jgi:hypothetical protein
MKIKHYPDNWILHLILMCVPATCEDYPSWAPNHRVSYKKLFNTAYVYEAID